MEYSDFDFGKCVKGTRLKIQANVPGRKPTVFNGRLLACREMEKPEWKGYTIASFIFTGLHSFEIIPLNDNQVKFVNKESFWFSYTLLEKESP